MYCSLGQGGTRLRLSARRRSPRSSHRLAGPITIGPSLRRSRPYATEAVLSLLGQGGTRTLKGCPIGF